VITALAVAFAGEPAEVPTVGSLDLQRYQGTWYELASFPNWFQRGCHATIARYTLEADGQIRVENTCRRGSLDGREVEAVGRARRPDPSKPGQLEVSFFWPFWSGYWVVDLDPQYRWAIVGSPDRDYLWFLSRERHVSSELLGTLKERAEAAGFDVTQLELTVQP